MAPEDVEIRHSFQTNGTLITDKWCEFIKKWHIGVGISIDGPKELHDLYRKYRDGSGSFDKAHKGLQLLNTHGIPSYVISVLTAESMARPEALLDFYAENHIEYVGFNVEEQEGVNTNSGVVGMDGIEGVYRSFLERFLDLAIRRKQNISVREIENRLQVIHAYGQDMENDQADPFRIISVDCEGNVSTFSPELLGLEHEAYGSFSFGNLVSDDFEDIARRVSESRLYADILDGIQRCKETCEYYNLCGGGAPANKIYENGSASSTETVYCRTNFKVATDITLDLIERLPRDLPAAWNANWAEHSSA